APQGQALEMEAADGQPLTGTLYGEGEVGLVLCHGRAYTKGAGSFAAEAQWLASRGIRCLALSFRGYPGDAPAQSMEGQDLDVLAAFDRLAEAGAKRIYVLGSSMGGFAALKALKRLSEKEAFAGIVILSAFTQEKLRGIGGRKLFVVAEDDRRLLTPVLRNFLTASGPKHCIVYASGGHGQRLLQTHRAGLLAAIHTFVTAPAE
ncbi:MAG: alpha/beta hydrolase family protein, partial [Planctomycetota bacterium]